MCGNLSDFPNIYECFKQIRFQNFVWILFLSLTNCRICFGFISDFFGIQNQVTGYLRESNGPNDNVKRLEGPPARSRAPELIDIVHVPPGKSTSCSSKSSKRGNPRHSLMYLGCSMLSPGSDV